ncbi:helix-turn-helix domain-containing protein [Mesorhizobium sp. CA13]|uniref:helix-turn-helix domain-containing protein n=1 Tax=Mesorhizobium sp. CA13 TaxID=2876643 RepID=UPI001CCC9ED8|nr:helix-turn-helix domain-containing protein [Mesorhizobium sp. CA13]MBZ9852828.1 helix-turn-helix domain-containing protein [Mesorhizobium sp. CA13]
MTDITRIDEQAARLKKAREMRGFDSAKAAASYFGFNYNTYAQHENGRAGITRAAKEYARAFRVREAWLITGEGLPQDIDGSDELREVFTRLATAPREVQAAVITYARFALGEPSGAEKSRETATTPTS